MLPLCQLIQGHAQVNIVLHKVDRSSNSIAFLQSRVNLPQKNKGGYKIQQFNVGYLSFTHVETIFHEVINFIKSLYPIFVVRNRFCGKIKKNRAIIQGFGRGQSYATASCTLTVVPFPGAELMSSLPLYRANLFLILIRPAPFWGVSSFSYLNPLPLSVTRISISLFFFKLMCIQLAPECFKQLFTSSCMILDCFLQKQFAGGTKT